MNIMGKSLGQYLSFVKGGLIFITVVWLARPILDSFDVSLSVAKYISVSMATLILIIYFALKVHTCRFGSYPQLLIIYFLCSAWMNFLVIMAILYAEKTGTENIYSRPEYSGHSVSYTTHILGHVALIGFLTLFSFGVGSLILFLLRKLEKPN